MTFTYDLSSSDERQLAVAQVRLELGDNVYNAGVKPDGSNFSDEELGSWLDTEDDHVMHTVIRACDALARMWNNVANITVGPRREELGKVADDWAKRAKELRDEYGSTIGGSGSAGFGVASARVDGYSENADSGSL